LCNISPKRIVSIITGSTTFESAEVGFTNKLAPFFKNRVKLLASHFRLRRSI